MTAARARVLSFGCMHATGSADTAVIPVPCGGRLDPSLLLLALSSGADGVALLTCQPGECRHHRCDEEPCVASGAEVVAELRRLLAPVGVSPKRLVHRTVGRGEDVAELIAEVAQEVSRLPSLARRSFELLPSSSEAASALDRAVWLSARLQAMVGASGQPLSGSEVLWTGCGELRSVVSGDVEARTEAAERLWALGGADGRPVLAGRCCGAPLLAAGEPEAFTAVARDTARLLAGVKRVVLPCPHCAVTMTERFREVGVTLGPEVIGLADWAAEALEVRPAGTEGLSLALVDTTTPAPSMGQVPAELRLLASAASVTHLEAPEALVEPGASGAARREAVEGLRAEAARRGVAAVVVSCPHLASRWRQTAAEGGWSRGPLVPIVDLAGALDGLLVAGARG